MARIARNMYGKIFASLWEGSLRGQPYPQLVFINMICTCSPDGIVDRMARAIADETGIPLTDVDAAIALLEAPDPLSRTPEQEGRRIVRLSDQRPWGWQIVNHAFYRKCITETVKRDMNRQYQAAYRQRQRDVTVTSPLPVELPNGFPATLEAAIAASLSTGAPPDFVEEVWLLAVSRGGKDAKGNPINHWPSHVSISKKWADNRKAEKAFGAEQAATQASGAMSGQAVTPWKLKTQIEAIEKEMARLRNAGGSEVAGGYEWHNPKIKLDWQVERKKKDALEKTLRDL